MTVAAPPSRPRADRLYPTLTPAQLERVAAHGRRRQVAQGEVLVQAGESAVRVFVILAGQIDVVRPSAAEEVVISFGPGMFTGEATMLSGRRGLAQVRAGADGEVIEIARDDLLALIQTDGELSAIFMRAFILRRVELIARGVSDVVVLGSTHCKGTLRVREFLTRNGHPHTMLDLDRDPGVQELLDRFHITPGDIPVILTCSELVLRNPTNQQIADALGFNDSIDQTHVRDLVIVGAGPSQCTEPPKDWMCWSWSPPRREARPARAPGSRTTSAFRRGSPVWTWRHAPPIRHRSSGHS